MTAIDESRVFGEAATAFRTALADAVLTAFAGGVDVERAWRIESPVADAPSWLVTVSRVETDKENDFEPSVIEE